jgi:hypothetical protein
MIREKTNTMQININEAMHQGQKIVITKKDNKFYFSINGVCSPCGFFSASSAEKYARGIISRGENLGELIRQGRGKA